MQLHIDIGGIIEKREFEQTKVLVGANAQCDIQLSYEGIGEEHLSIQLVDGLYQVVDLNSGSETFINGALLPAGTSATLKSKSEVELGGVLITVEIVEVIDKDIFQFETDSKLEFEDKGDKTQSIDDLLEALNSSQSTSTDNLSHIEHDLDVFENATEENEQSEVVGESAAIEAKKFRPDLFSDKKNDDHDVAHQKKTTDSTISKGVRSRKKARSRRVKSSSDKNKEKSGKNLYVFLLILLVAGGYYGYKNYQKTISTGTKAKTSSRLKLPENLSPNLKAEVLNYAEYIKQQSCNKPELDLVCNQLRNTFGEATPWKIVIRGETLIIGFEDKGLVNYINKLLAPLALDDQALEIIVNANYQDFFTYKEFAANNNLPPAKKFTYFRNDNSELFFLLSVIFKERLDIPKKYNKMFLFVYSNFLGEVVPKEFLSLKTENYEREIQLKDSTLSRISAAWNYHLTQDFDILVSGIGASSNIDFNIELAKNTLMLSKRKLINDNLKAIKCASPNLFSVCLDIGKNSPISLFEGAVADEGSLLLYLDLDKVEALFKGREFPEYDNSDRVKLLSQISNKSLKEKKEFQINGYVGVMEKDDFLVQLLLASFYESAYHKDLLNQNRYQSLSIVGFRQETEGKAKILNVVSAPIEIFKAIENEKVSEKLVYLLRSKVSLFTPILEKVVMPTTF